jgi:hypothetical protein
MQTPKRAVIQRRSKTKAEYFSTLEKTNVTIGNKINISVGTAYAKSTYIAYAFSRDEASI